MSKRPATLADTLRQAIRCSGITQTEVAQLAGIHQVQLSYFVNGHHDLSMRNADKLLRFFNLVVVPKDEVPRSSR